MQRIHSAVIQVLNTPEAQVEALQAFVEQVRSCASSFEVVTQKLIQSGHVFHPDSNEYTRVVVLMNTIKSLSLHQLEMMRLEGRRKIYALQAGTEGSRKRRRE